MSLHETTVKGIGPRRWMVNCSCGWSKLFPGNKVVAYTNAKRHRETNEREEE